jgi:KDO2-lipid IV(A) lauroyltransferase
MKSRRAIISNLCIAFNKDKSTPEIDLYARKTFQQFAKYLGDFFRFSRINKENLSEYLSFKGLENIDKALSLNRGVIVVTMHLGNWELGGIALAMKGYPVSAVALSHEQRKVNGLFIKQREEKGIKVIPLGLATRKCIQALKNKEILGLVGDRDIYSHGLKVKFFNKETTIPKGPVILSLKMAAPIVMVFCIRQPNDRFVMYLEKPIFIEGKKDYNDNDIEKLSGRIVKIMENYILKYPDQWVLFHRVWPKTSEVRSQKSEVRRK